MGQYDRVTFEGVRVTRRQRQALKQGANPVILKRFNKLLHPYQGSWRPKTDYSGTTHTGAGVCDLYVYGMSTMKWDDLKEITRLIRREARQAAFLRGPFCNMPWHWHVLDIDTHGMDEWAATSQIPAYRKGLDGLSGGGKDPVIYRPRPIREWKFQS